MRLSWSGFQAGGQHVPWSHVKLKPNLSLSLNLSLHNLSLGLDRIRYELAHVHSIGLSWTNARRRDIGATTHDRFVSRRGTRQSNAGAIAACEVHASINIAVKHRFVYVIGNTSVAGAVLTPATWQRNRTADVAHLQHLQRSPATPCGWARLTHRMRPPPRGGRGGGAGHEADGGRAMPRPQGRNHRGRVFECEIDPRRFGSPVR